VFFEYPRYRSQHLRYWDRPIQDHVRELLLEALEDQPLSWPQLRARLPAYTRTLAQRLLYEDVARGFLFLHPRLSHGTDRYSFSPPDVKNYVRSEMDGLFHRLERLGFSRVALQDAARELLTDQELAEEPCRVFEPAR
jgi:hypothetical protein